MLSFEASCTSMSHSVFPFITALKSSLPFLSSLISFNKSVLLSSSSLSIFIFKIASSIACVILGFPLENNALNTTSFFGCNMLFFTLGICKPPRFGIILI